mgnify:CR=1 FL=1
MASRLVMAQEAASASANDGGVPLQPAEGAGAGRGRGGRVVGLSAARPRFRNDSRTARNDALDRLSSLGALLQRILRDALLRLEGRSVFASVRVRRHKA